MRTTIHLVSRREFWRYAMGVRQARRTWALRMRSGVDAVRRRGCDGRPRPTRCARPWPTGRGRSRSSGRMGAGFVGSLGLWVDLVRVPPSGTWERRRADRLALAETWVGPPDATEAEGLAHLVRAYLRAFGPARLEGHRGVGRGLGHGREAGRGAARRSRVPRRRRARLLGPAGAPTSLDGREPAPVRFLPHWDANLLVHARRTGVAARAPSAAGLQHEELRSRSGPCSSMAGSRRPGRSATAPSWSTELEPIAPAARDAIEDERAGLERFHA